MKSVYKKRTVLGTIGTGLIIVMTACAVLFAVWYQTGGKQPLGQPLDLVPTQPAQADVSIGNQSLLPKLIQKVKSFFNSLGLNPVCGSEGQWTVLAVGIDYRGGDYLYGLADVIRVVQIDFKKPQVNVVAIPRNLLVDPPQRLDAQGPLLLNQAYFFGTEGMQYYRGTGFGAGSLAATLQNSFDVTPQHYLVVNFEAFVKFVDAIGGIEVDLPAAVDNMPTSFYPAGKQTLTGEQALDLGRVREKYSDLQRIDNQSVILKGILQKLKDPAVLAKLPAIYRSMKGSIITDATPDQVTNLICLLPKLSADKVQFFSPPKDLLTAEMVYIPNLNADMQIFRWDKNFTDWVHQSLQAPAP